MRRPALGIGVLLALLLVAGTASAELTAKGDLFVRFDGGLAPISLPRRSPAPIAVRIEGTIHTPTRRRPPALRQITVALNSAGRLDSTGLPTCRAVRIEADTPEEALRACGPAEVGGGGFTAISSFPDQPDYPFQGEILLFNARVQGHQAILAHVFQAKPAPISRVFTFKITHAKGTFGTVIVGQIPKEQNENGYLKTIYLQLHRSFTANGKSHSYLSAACSAPEGITEALFPFARASMSFADGRTLSTVMTRSCRVRN